MGSPAEFPRRARAPVPMRIQHFSARSRARFSYPSDHVRQTAKADAASSAELVRRACLNPNHTFEQPSCIARSTRNKTMKHPLAIQAARKTVSTLRRTSSLGTLFGERICPLFLTGALLAAPGVAQADDVILDFDTFLSNGGLTLGPGDTFIVQEGVTVETTDAEGVYAWQLDGITVINNGTIRTFGDYLHNVPSGTNGYGDGIFIGDSEYATAINNGWISISDTFTNGIYAYEIGNGFTGINNGTIVIEADAAQDNLDDDNGTPNDTNDDIPVLDPNGDPFRSAIASAGIRVDAYDASNNPSTGHHVVNNGLIQSYVLQSRGMFIDGNGYSGPYQIVDSTMINNGTIEMLSEDPSNGTYDVSGMRIEGHNGTMINNGLVRIVPRGFGLENNGAGGTVLNFGEILIDGENIADSRSYGIEHYRNGDNIVSAETSLTVNAGKIHATGPTTDGLAISGHSNHRVVNYGRILSEQGYSIRINTGLFDVDGTTIGQNTVYLFDGSILFGDVFLSDVSLQNTDFRLGDGLNAAVRFDTTNGNLPLDIASRHGHVIVDDTLYVVDLDSYAQQDQVAWSMLSQIQNAIDDGTEARPPAGDFAFNGDADGMANRWARVFGGWVQEEGDDDVSYLDTDADHTPGYTGYSVGTIVGVNKENLSVFAGAAYSSVSGDEDVSYDTYSGTVFGGITKVIAERLNVSLTAGAAYNRTDRDMADNRVADGIDSDTANYASVFLSPSLLVKGPIAGSTFRVNYLGTWTQGHDFDFSGGTQLDVDSRFSNVIGAQVQMAHNLPLVNDSFSTRIRYGVEASYADGQSVGYNLMGTDLETPYDNGFTARGFAALEVGPTYIEAGYNTDEQVSINAGLKLRF